MRNKIENMVAKLIHIIPIRIRFYLFYFIGSLMHKLLSLKMKTLHKYTISNYKRYLESQGNPKSSIKNFHSKFAKCRSTQAGDFLTFLSASEKEMEKKMNISFQGKELLDKYITQKKGVILVLPHISSYSSMPLLLTKFLKLKINEIALFSATSSLFESNIPDKWGSGVLDRLNMIDVSVLTLVKAYDVLNKGEILLIMPELATSSFSDMEGYSKFMFELDAPVEEPLSDYKVSFLNETIYAAPGIATLSLKTEAPVLSTVIRKNGNLNYDVTFKEIEFSKNKEDLQKNIQLLYQTVEKEILVKPYEWVVWSFFHKLICDSNNSHVMAKNEN